MAGSAAKCAGLLVLVAMVASAVAVDAELHRILSDDEIVELVTDTEVKQTSYRLWQEFLMARPICGDMKGRFNRLSEYSMGTSLNRCLEAVSGLRSLVGLPTAFPMPTCLFKAASDRGSWYAINERLGPCMAHVFGKTEDCGSWECKAKQQDKESAWSFGAQTMPCFKCIAPSCPQCQEFDERHGHERVSVVTIDVTLGKCMQCVLDHTLTEHQAIKASLQRGKELADEIKLKKRMRNDALSATRQEQCYKNWMSLITSVAMHTIGEVQRGGDQMEATKATFAVLDHAHYSLSVLKSWDCDKKHIPGMVPSATGLRSKYCSNEEDDSPRCKACRYFQEGNVFLPGHASAQFQASVKKFMASYRKSGLPLSGGDAAEHVIRFCDMM